MELSILIRNRIDISFLDTSRWIDFPKVFGSHAGYWSLRMRQRKYHAKGWYHCWTDADAAACEGSKFVIFSGVPI